MRVSLDVLRRWTDRLPGEDRAARLLFDDLGLEVKRDEGGGRFTLELLANRGDHRCYLGIAREIAGRNGGQVCVPPSAVLTEAGRAHPDAGLAPHVRIETELCFRYAAVPLVVLHHDRPLSQDARDVLAAADIHELSATVDATNVANLELGQPTHAFDADCIVGAITIRLSRPGEQALPLFATERITLPEGTIVIADDVKVLAVAGVIGCEESKVTDGTRRIVLESATFDPVSVHKASRRLGIQTDASARFERGADVEMVLPGAGRVVQLLEEAGAAWRTGPAVVAGPGLPAVPDVTVSLAEARAYFGLQTEVGLADFAAEMSERLRCLGFGVAEDAATSPANPAAGPDHTLRISIPSWRRWEVKNRWDLFEEMARAMSYERVAAVLPPVSLGAVPTRPERRRAELAEVMVGAGFQEVVTFGFYGREHVAKLGVVEGDPLWPHLELLNSLERGYSLLKNTPLVHALLGCAENQNFGVDQVRTFEFTRTFHPDGEGVRERPVFWALACGPERSPDWAHKPAAADVWFLKGLVEELAVRLGLPLTVRACEGARDVSGRLHPHRRADIVLDGAVVGILGEVHPRVAAAFEVRRGRPAYLELDLDALDVPERRADVKEPPPRPPSVRSLAFSLPHGVEAGAVVACLRTNGPEWLAGVAVTDLYAHELDGVPVRTITCVLSYRNDDAALSVETLNTTTEVLAAAVEATLGGAGVKLRR